MNADIKKCSIPFGAMLAGRSFTPEAQALQNRLNEEHDQFMSKHFTSDQIAEMRRNLHINE